MRRVIFVLLATSASAQFISVGVQGGVPITQAFDAKTDPNLPDVLHPPQFFTFGHVYSSAIERTVPYIIGPAIEIHIKGPFRVSAEGLYSRAIYDYTAVEFISPSSGNVSFGSKHAVSRWEFPVILRYYTLAWHNLHPFVAAGVSTQYSRNYEVGFLEARFEEAGLFLSTHSGGPSARSAVVGPVFAVGSSFGARSVRPSVEFRYTRWTGEATNPVDRLGPGNVALHAAQNQAQFLVGIMF